MIATSLVGILLLALPTQTFANSSFGTKTSSTKEELANGVHLVHEQYSNGSRHHATHVLDVAYRNSSVNLELYHPTPLGKTQTTTQQAIANNREGHYVVGAVNASFYNMGTGFPVNLLVKQNEILNYGILSADRTGPVNAPFAFGINRNGALTISDYQANMSFQHNGKSYTLSAVNNARMADTSVIYTGGYSKAATGASPNVTEIVVANTTKSAEKFGFGDQIKGTVTEVRPLGSGANSPIPKDGFVISANGKILADQLANVKVGDEISVNASINDTWRDAQFVMATGPTLVRNGQVSISMSETSAFAKDRHPRTAVGVSSDGTKVFLVTIDGRQSGYSVGATLRELADYMKSLGAYQAINLDGGGSTEMAARLPYLEQPVLVNKPSEGRQRAVPTTLQVVSTEAPKRVTQPMIVVDPMESQANWVATGARATASIAATNQFEPVRVGSKALKLTYDYTKGEAGTAAAYVKAKTPIPLKGRPLEMGMWAYGDGAEHWLRGTIIDSSGTRHTINFTADNQFNWTGWQYVRAQIPANLTGPFQLEQIYTAQTNQAKQGKGSIYFDQIEAIYQTNYTVQRFKDVSSSFWAHNAILALNDRQVINGFSDGSFRPRESITREQTAVMIARALNLPMGGTKTTLKDVAAESFYYDAIAAVEKAGIMGGKSVGRFHPKDTLTRAEMAIILQRAYSIGGSSVTPFPDVAQSHWAFQAIDAMKASHVTVGLPDGGYGPSLPTTRADFAVFLDRVATMK